MTNGKRKRMMTGLLGICLLLILVIGAQMWSSLYQQRAVEYGATFVTATPAEVCPGETITYPVSIDITTTPSVSRITEGWCRDDGICPRALQSEPFYVNFVVPYSVQTTARRVVPQELTTGLWEYRHCNETHGQNLIDVQCYAVQVTVKDGCQ